MVATYDRNLEPLLVSSTTESSLPWAKTAGGNAILHSHVLQVIPTLGQKLSVKVEAAGLALSFH